MMIMITVITKDSIAAIDIGKTVLDRINFIPILIASVIKPVNKVIHMDMGVCFL